MKIPVTGISAAAVFAISATLANSQTLGTAANYDILGLNGGVVELTSSNKLFGQVGFSNNVNVKAGKNSQAFQGTVFKHTGAKIDKPDSLSPSGGIQTSSSIDAALDQANVDVADYVNYLKGLSSTQSFGNVSTNFSFTSSTDLTVLDFTTLDLDKETFTLNGSASGTDRFVIRVSDAFEFKASDLVTTNLSVDNVIFYYTGNKQFDLHKSTKNDPDNFMKFAGTIVAPDGQVRLGEVNFTGKVIGTDLKLGSGFAFQGTVPEPSSSLMLLFGAGSLLLVRRRKS